MKKVSLLTLIEWRHNFKQQISQTFQIIFCFKHFHHLFRQKDIFYILTDEKHSYLWFHVHFVHSYECNKKFMSLTFTASTSTGYEKNHHMLNVKLQPYNFILLDIFFHDNVQILPTVFLHDQLFFCNIPSICFIIWFYHIYRYYLSSYIQIINIFT